MIEDCLNCVRSECRSPYSCASIDRCADTLTPTEDSRLFGYGNNSGKYGDAREPRPEWTKSRAQRALEGGTV